MSEKVELAKAKQFHQARGHQVQAMGHKLKHQEQREKLEVQAAQAKLRMKAKPMEQPRASRSSKNLDVKADRVPHPNDAPAEAV